MTEDRLLLAREFIDNNATRRVHLDELAAMVQVSRWHLVRMFKSRFGVPPCKYLQTVRLSRARALLAAGMPPSRVACELGFSDYSHMSREFRRAFGLPPGRFRRLLAVAVDRDAGLGIDVQCDPATIGDDLARPATRARRPTSGAGRCGA